MIKLEIRYLLSFFTAFIVFCASARQFDTSKCNSLLSDLADSSYSLIEAEPEHSYDLAKQCLELSKECKKSWYEGFSLKLQGSYHYYNSNYDSAIIYFKKSAEVFKSINDSGFVADALGLLAQSLLDKGAVKQSLKEVNRSLEFVYYNGVSDYNLAYGLVTPTLILADLDRPKALFQLLEIKQLFDGSDLYSKEEDGYFYQLTCIYLAKEYYKRKEWKKLDETLNIIAAQDTFFLSINNKSDYHLIRAALLSHQGRDQNEIQHHLNSARAAYDTATIEDNLTYQYPYYYADIALKTDTNHAITLLKNALAENDDYWWGQYKLLKKLINILESSNRLDEAYIYLKKFNRLEDQINLNDISYETVNLKLKREAFEKQQILKEKELLEEYRAKQEANNQLKNALIIMLCILVGFAVLLIIYMFKLSKERKQILNSKDKLISVLGHDLRTPLSQIQGIINLAKSNLVSKKELNSLFNDVEVELTRAQNKLENVLQWALNQLSDMSPRPKAIEVNQALNEAILFNEIYLKKKKLEVNINIENGLQLKSDPDQLQIILRNLIGNAIKFSTENNTIELIGYSNIENKTVSIEIRDNGIGMTKDQLKKINDFSTLKSSKGTSGEKGSGMGLLLVKTFIQANHGKLLIKSIEGKGSTFTILLPSANNPNS